MQNHSLHSPGRRSVAVAAVALAALWASQTASAEPLPGWLDVPPEAPGWLGVMMDSTVQGSAVVRRVLPGSPAARAGLEAGATIAAVNGEPVDSSRALIQAVARHPVGATITLDLREEAALRSVTVLLGPRADASRLADLLVGHPLPPMALTDASSGLPVTTATGASATVVEFWATWCGPCHLTQPSIRALRDRWPEDRLAIIGISDESPSTVDRFGAEAAIPWTLAIDATGDAQLDALVTALPTFFLLDADGNVVAVAHGAGEVTAFIAATDRLVASSLDGDPQPSDESRLDR